MVPQPPLSYANRNKGEHDNEIKMGMNARETRWLVGSFGWMDGWMDG